MKITVQDNFKSRGDVRVVNSAGNVPLTVNAMAVGVVKQVAVPGAGGSRDAGVSGVKQKVVPPSPSGGVEHVHSSKCACKAAATPGSSMFHRTIEAPVAPDKVGKTTESARRVQCAKSSTGCVEVDDVAGSVSGGCRAVYVAW